jgi:transposase-like protein
MPKKFPQEFKRDVVTVARRGDLTVPEVAVDFGVSEESVRRWVRQADIDEGITGGQTTTEQTELVQLHRTSPSRGCGTRRPGRTRRYGRRDTDRR